MAITLRLRIEFSGERSDLEVVLPNDATVATLIDLLDGPGDDVMVDGRIVPSWQTLPDAKIRDGAVIDLDRTEPSTAWTATPVVSLDKLAGHGGPVTEPLAPGTHEFAADAVGSSAFALLVEDRGAVTVLPRGGPIVVDNVLIDGPTAIGDEVFIVGGARYRVTAPPDDASTSTIAPLPRHRAPIVTGRRIAPVALPRMDDRAPQRLWLNLVPICVILGVLGVVVSPAFFMGAGAALVAAFVLLLRERNRNIAHGAALRAETVTTIENFSRKVARERWTVAADLRNEHPALPDLVRRAETRQGFGLRHADEHDFGRVAVGYGDRPWKISVDSDFVLEPQLQAVVDANDVLASVPITIDLTAGPVGIAGPRTRRLALARALAAEVCSRWSAADVRFAIAAEEGDLVEWDWAKWAPHFGVNGHVATSIEAADRMVSSWRTPGHDWLQLVFVDQPKWLEHEGSLLEVIAREPGRQCPVVLAETMDELPTCATTIELVADGTMTVRTRAGETHRFVSPRHAPVAAVDVIVRAAAAGGDTGRPADRDEQAHGVRPFQLESSTVEEAMVRPLDPPPVPTARPTVIRAPATGAIDDDGALTPPAVPEPEEPIIDLRDDAPPKTDSASDDSGTRWTRARR